MKNILIILTSLQETDNTARFTWRKRSNQWKYMINHQIKQSKTYLNKWKVAKAWHVVEFMHFLKRNSTFRPLNRCISLLNLYLHVVSQLYIVIKKLIFSMDKELRRKWSLNFCQSTSWLWNPISPSKLFQIIHYTF